MFKFFRVKRAKNNWNSDMDLYELNEQEAKCSWEAHRFVHLIGGYRPALAAEHAYDEVRGTRLPAISGDVSPASWQQPPGWDAAAQGQYLQ